MDLRTGLETGAANTRARTRDVVGIHVYGADICAIERRAYDPATGAVRWFVSDWDTPVADVAQPL